MTNKIPKILENTYQTFLDLVFYPNNPIDMIDQYVSEEVMGYGTTLDEKIFDIKGLKDLAVLQRSQVSELQFRFTPSKVYRYILEDGRMAVLVDEIKITMTIEGENIDLNLRMSTVWELINENWKLIHWHGSKPEYDSGGTDTWHAEEWKQKNEALQKLVDEKTADLVYKNYELEIEAALERVRSVAMGMNAYDDLLNICEVSFHEFKNLGFDSLRNAVIHIQNDEQKYFMDYDFSDFTGGQIGKVSYGLHPVIDEYVKKIRSAEDAYFEVVIEEDMLDGWNDFRKKSGQMHDPRLEKAKTLYYYLFSIGIGDIGISTFEPISDSQIKTLKRFRNVFGLAYRRYTDIALAESQRREAEIQLALERVRARTMAMQKSEELLETVSLIYNQLREMGEEINQITIGVFKEENLIDLFGTMKGDQIQTLNASIEQSSVMSKVHKAWKAGEKSLIIELSGEELINYNNWRNKFLNKEIYPTNNPNDSWFVNAAMFSKGILGFSSDKQVSKEANELLERFAAVFNLTYTRFLDLKKAEAQARESQIEVALERVRARAMAMHNSEELSAVASVLFEQMRILGGDLFAFGIVLCDKYENEVEQWHSIGEEGMMMPFRIPIDLDYIHQYRYNKWKSGESLFSVEIPEDYIQRHFERMFEVPSFKVSMDDVAERGINITTPSWEIDYGASFSHGYLLVSSLSPFKEDYIFPRFAKVFEQAYTRFLDLKKAEEQAKEALVELALERVRAKVTAMSESTDLLDIVVTMRTEFVSLGHQAGYFWYMSWLPEKYEKAMTSGDGTKIGMVMTLPRHIHGDIPLVANWEKSDEPTVVLAMDVETAVDYVDKMITLGDFEQVDPNAPTLDDIRHIGGLTFVMARTTHGEIGFSLNGTVPHPPQKDLDTLVRFAAVFDLAYSRFEDLKNAEARTKEALKQATLDRVRAQVASMRNPDDLQQITPLIWQELNTLEVPFSRCGVFIVDEKQKHVNVYLSAPDGKALAALDLKFDANKLTKKTLEHWRQNKVYHQHWNQEEFMAWTQEMMKLRQIKTAKDYTGGNAPPKSLHLYFVPFTQGMLYVGHSEALNDTFVDLIKSLAKAFSFAYARYEDFVVLEDAKAKVEKTLMDLKATQSQLIHAEKMASLGELTAGIAHEIQNPLNFVNNFSEVSTDLIEELNEELKKGDLEEVRAIAEDLIQNLEKINNHGKRASSIVKGMLEHSRSGSGEKIPTDINILADEYLRLAYHGLRAKNKSFNADFKMMADEELPHLNIVPQDIGRVLLNLINNAFYAVDEKVKQNTEAYKPQVVVSTAKLGDGVEIRVKDNGNGIPDKVKEKIFQPFFTTKPTGQGTGLGLSMSYDIITKGHNGALKVETLSGKGTEFIIELPTKT